MRFCPLFAARRFFGPRWRLLLGVALRAAPKGMREARLLRIGLDWNAPRPAENGLINIWAPVQLFSRPVLMLTPRAGSCWVVPYLLMGAAQEMRQTGFGWFRLVPRRSVTRRLLSGGAPLRLCIKTTSWRYKQ